jgi:hypothetical protein
MRRPWPTRGSGAIERRRKKKKKLVLVKRFHSSNPTNNQSCNRNWVINLSGQYVMAINGFFSYKYLIKNARPL